MALAVWLARTTGTVTPVRHGSTVTASAAAGGHGASDCVMTANRTVLLRSLRVSSVLP